MTSFSKQTQHPEESQPGVQPQGGRPLPVPGPGQQAARNAGSYANEQNIQKIQPSSSLQNTPVPPTPQVPISPNPARQNHGGSQGYGSKPTGGLGLLQRVRTGGSPEVEGTNLILYRAQNFFLRTSYQPGQTAAPFRRPTGRTTNLPKIMPDQEERVAASETRMMPVVSTINPVNKKGRIPVPRWLEVLVVLLGLFIAGFAHTLNMFNFPRYQLDEGTYMASASAILNGQLWPYAYGYGHPPLAWMQIAAWVQFTGGFFIFGNAINTGRVLMLLYALGSTLLVYLIVRRFGASRSAGLLAMIIFSLSPLSITYQREVLLDNVATFWLLLSLYLLVVSNSRLVYIALSAVTMGISILSKEVMVLFIPAMIYAAWLHTTQFQRKFAVVAFIYGIIAVSSSFVLLAVLKGELFPQGFLPWDHSQHLSLIQTFIGQSERTQTEGSFSQSFSDWWYADKIVISVGILAIAFNLLMGWWNRKQLLLALLAISFWLLLVRGGIVLPFYLIPLIPLMAINAAMAIHTIMNWIGQLVRFDVVRVLLIFGVIAAIIPYDITNTGDIFTQHPTSAQNQAITWVRQHVPHNDFIVINSWLYMDLRGDGGIGVGNGANYPYAHVYQNVATDPAITNAILDNNWDRIDYIVADSDMLTDIKNEPKLYGIITQALNSSVIDAQFSTPDGNTNIVITIFEVKHKFTPDVVQSTQHNTASNSALAVNVIDSRTMRRSNGYVTGASPAAA